MPTLPLIYFERLLEDSPDIIIGVDRHGEIIFYNEGARTTLGYTSEEIAGNSVKLIYPSIEEARELMRAMRDPETDAAGKVRNFQTRLRTRSGEELDVAISGTLIFDSAGRELGSIGFAKDLREIHKQDQLATLQEIAVTVAHEMNNPLAAILNNLDMLGKDIRQLAGEKDTCVEQERMDSMNVSLKKIQNIVNRLSEMAGSREYGTVEYLHGAKMTDLGPGIGGTQQHAAEKARRQPKADGALHNLCVLVADDDLAVCQSIQDILEREGCEVVTAADGIEARDRIANQSFDCVLSDVVMPGLDGYELFLHIQEHHPRTPVVLMTAFVYDREHIIKRAKLEGLEGVLFKKPVEPAQLVEILKSQCGRD